jgi:DNA-binding transcriptional MerR regulator
MSDTPNKQAITGPKSPYGRVFIEILLDETMSNYAKLCYAVMTSFGPDPTTWASITTISKRMSVSEGTARKAQRELEEFGWIIKGKEIPGTTIHWKMLAPFERTPSQREGVHRVRGGGSPGEGEGFTTGGGGVHAVNPKQEGNHEPNQEPKKEKSPVSPTEQKKEEIPEKKQRTKKNKEDSLQELKNSPTGKIFKEVHDEKEGYKYYFDYQDLELFEQSKDLGLTEAEIKAALISFFDRGSSWHAQTGHTKFKNFIKNIRAYVKASGKATQATKAELSRYYEPWDPRHPYYIKGDLVQSQQKRNWENEHGPWTPKPEWKSKE